MKIRFDEAKELLWKDSGQGYSAMGFTKVKLYETLKKCNINYKENDLLTVGISITDKEATDLYDMWFTDRYTKFQGVHFETSVFSSKKDIAKTICIAIKTNTPLCVIFEDNYCQYPSDEEIDPMVSQDGLTHIIMVGKTTGDKAFPLALASKYSDGGDILDLYGIKEVILLKGI